MVGNLEPRSQNCVKVAVALNHDALVSAVVFDKWILGLAVLAVEHPIYFLSMQYTKG